MNGSADTDDIGASQTGTASTAITLNGLSSFITSTDTDGLVDAESIVGAGDLTIDAKRKIKLIKPTQPNLTRLTSGIVVSSPVSVNRLKESTLSPQLPTTLNKLNF